MAERRQMKIRKRKPAKKKTTMREKVTSFAKSALRGFVALLAISIMGGSAFAGHKVLTEGESLQVAKLEVSGTSVVKKNDVSNMIGYVFGLNIFRTNLTEMGEILERHPWIKSVEVRRELPESISIIIEERTAIARLSYKSELWLIDSEGVILEKSDSTAPYPLLINLNTGGKKIVPGVSVGAKKIESALMALRELDGYRLLGKIKLVGVDLKESDRLEMVFEETMIRVIAPRKTWTDEAQRLYVVDYLLRNKEPNLDITAISLMFQNKVIVKQADV